MKPAATVGSVHLCPMWTGLVPHIGGPIVMGESTILINGVPAATVGSMCVCIGPPDVVAMGNASVLFNGKPAACLGDMTAHGGIIMSGDGTVLIGAASGAPSTPAVPPVAEIPFPEFSLVTKVRGNRNQLREARNNQQALREAPRKDINASNLQWLKERDGEEISQAFIGETVVVSAHVSGADVEEGMYLGFRVMEKDDQGNDDYVTTAVGEVVGGRVQVAWEVPYVSDDDDLESDQEQREGRRTMPEYVIVAQNSDGSNVESGLLEVDDCLELKLIDLETEEPQANAHYQLLLADGRVIEGQLDADGYDRVPEVRSSEEYIVLLQQDDQAVIL